MLGNTGSANVFSNNLEPRILRKASAPYNYDGFWTHAQEFGHENNKNFRKGPIEAGVGVLGLGYQTVIVANQTAQVVAKPFAWLIGGLGGGLSNLIGNKKTNIKQGIQDGDDFVERVGANTWGGRSFTEADGEIGNAMGPLVTLNFKEAGRHLKKGLAAPTKYEYGWFNEITAETTWVVSHILPFINWTHGSNGASCIGGGRGDAGVGGNGSNTIETIFEVGGRSIGVGGF